MKKIINFLESEKVGRHSSKIAIMTFIICFIIVGMLMQFAKSVDGEATDIRTNEVRMQSIEYVFMFDETVSTETKENILAYFYDTIDSAKLLDMVNMRQHVYFTSKDTELEYVEDGILCSTSIQIMELEEAMKKLP
jgi:hypothetical protein